MPIKALRLQIIKPYNGPDEETPVTWETLGQTLRDLRYAASRMANYVIQQQYAWQFFRQKYKAEHGEYPPAAEHKDMYYCYPVLTKMFPNVAAQAVNQIEQRASQVWSSRKTEVLSLRQSVPSFKLNFPIVIHRKSYSIHNDPENLNNYKNHKYLIKANLTSKIYGRTSYSVLVDAGENSKQSIVERIISGEYRQGALQIISDRRGKWYCIIPYEFAVEVNEELDPHRIMGIDLGISKAVYWAFSDSHKRGFIEGGEITQFRKGVQARRKSIQEQGKQCGDGRIGHGRKRRLQPIEVLQDKEANFRDTANHRYSRRVIEEAVRNKCGVIQMENLTGIVEDKKNQSFLRNWTYHDLQTKIKDKAAEIGIEVRTVNPQYTSQRCSQCGHIDCNNRPNQATFICTSCGYGDLYHCFACGKSQPEAGPCVSCGASTKHLVVNADYNAAKNLSLDGIDEIISKALDKESGEGGLEHSKIKSAKPKRTPKTR